MLLSMPLGKGVQSVMQFDNLARVIANQRQPIHLKFRLLKHSCDNQHLKFFVPVEHLSGVLTKHTNILINLFLIQNCV